MIQNKDTQPEVFSTDQTSFSAEEPLFESAGLPTKPIDMVEGELPVKKPFYQSKAFLVSGGVLIAVLALVGVLIMMMIGSNGGQQVLEPSPSPVAQQTELDPIQQRINNLQMQLRASDPSDDPLPLPPVDLSISLEE
jgi:hypothetical protein